MPRVRCISPEKGKLAQRMCSSPKDCTLVCKNGNVAAHVLVLCSSSSYFLNLFQTQRPKFVFLPEFDATDIQRLVDLLYGQMVNVDNVGLISLMSCAQQLDIRGFHSDD